jgi:hypothetical protein
VLAETAVAGICNVQSWYYPYRSAYGAPRTDTRNIPLQKTTLSDDDTRLSVVLPDGALVPGRVYALMLGSQIRGAAGESMATREAFYTLNRLK